MEALLADVLRVLQLEPRGEDRYRAHCQDLGYGRVFGGQVLAQALMAAYATVEQRPVHSLHAYFLRAGVPDQPIELEVDRSRDGASFSSRRILAVQSGRQIFHMSASFQSAEEALERQGATPSVISPEAAPTMAEVAEEWKRLAPDRPRFFGAEKLAFEFRAASVPGPSEPIPQEPVMRLWFRAIDALPDDDALHRCLLAYVSDYYLLGVAGMDARLTIRRRELQMASLDHAMWFHRPARVDDWLLYDMRSPTASGARGLALGAVYSRDGQLVASTAQEGLVRRRGGES